VVDCGGDIADRMASRLARLFVRNKRHRLTGWDPASLGSASSCSGRAVHVCITKHELATVNLFLAGAFWG
jgi:hypothetical protein